MTIRDISSPTEKRAICDSILKRLPDWFGIPEAIDDYIVSVQPLPFFACFDGENAVGFLAVKPHNPYTAEIHVMGILTPYHRQGIGRQLVAACEEHCRHQQHQFLTVETLADTHPDPFYARTREFYMAMGFKPLQVIVEVWGESNPCLLMVKCLSANTEG